MPVGASEPGAVSRALGGIVRVSPQAASAASALFARVDVLSLTPTALAAASHLPAPEVRTLDALHAASAAELSDLDWLVTYDRGMRLAAESGGLPVVMPGP
jgi:predicted nucleic acid-binding protein